jgi:hypothetical protein
MNLSLDQAIEIHARALKYRFGHRASVLAKEKAHHCAARGDDEGRAVWQRVAAVVGMLPEARSQNTSVDETR